MESYKFLQIIYHESVRTLAEQVNFCLSLPLCVKIRTLSLSTGWTVFFFQGQLTFTTVANGFPGEERQCLGPSQRALSKDALLENYKKLLKIAGYICVSLHFLLWLLEASDNQSVESLFLRLWLKLFWLGSIGFLTWPRQLGTEKGCIIKNSH